MSGTTYHMHFPVVLEIFALIHVRIHTRFPFKREYKTKLKQPRYWKKQKDVSNPPNFGRHALLPVPRRDIFSEPTNEFPVIIFFGSRSDFS